MVKNRKYLKIFAIALAWMTTVLIVQIPFYRWFTHRMNPLRDYEVSVEMHFPAGAATSSVPWIYVYCDYGRKLIVPDIIWGGISHPELSFMDIDKDGIEDIVFGNEQLKQIVAFKPASDGNPPRFVILRNDMK